MASMLLCIATKSCTVPVITPTLLATASMMGGDREGTEPVVRMGMSQDKTVRASGQIDRTKKGKGERRHVASRCGYRLYYASGRCGKARKNETRELGLTSISMGKRVRNTLGQTGGSGGALSHARAQPTSSHRPRGLLVQMAPHFIISITSYSMSIGVLHLRKGLWLAH